MPKRNFFSAKVEQIPGIYQGDLSPGLLSGRQITHNLHRAHASPPEEQSLASFSIPEGAGRCMCSSQKLPGKVPKARGMRSVFQQITVPRARGLGDSWRPEELHRVSRRVHTWAVPGDGVQEAVLCNPCCKEISAALSTPGM